MCDSISFVNVDKRGLGIGVAGYFLGFEQVLNGYLGQGGVADAMRGLTPTVDASRIHVSTHDFTYSP